MRVRGSIKSNNLEDEIFIHSIDVDCSNGSSANIGFVFLDICKYSGDNHYAINTLVDFIEIDDEDYGEYEDDELFSILVNGMVFNVDLGYNGDSTLTLKSLVIEFDDDSTIILDVNDVNVNIVKQP